MIVWSIDAGFLTPFNQLKRSWIAVYQASIYDTTDLIHSWSPNDDILTLSTTHSGPKKVHLDRIKPAVDSLFTNLITALSSLLPHQMGFPWIWQLHLPCDHMQLHIFNMDLLPTKGWCIQQPGFLHTTNTCETAVRC